MAPTRRMTLAFLVVLLMVTSVPALSQQAGTGIMTGRAMDSSGAADSRSQRHHIESGNDRRPAKQRDG